MLYDDVEFNVSGSCIQEITASEDTYVEVPAPDKTHGTAQKLVIRGTLDDAYSRMTLLKFDISGIKDNVQSAWICLYGNYKSDLDSPQPIGVFDISDEWEQQTVTKNTAPERGEQIGEVTLGENLDWVKIDISDYLKQKLSEGAQNISVELYQEVSAKNNNTIYSTESLYKPFLGFSIEKAPTVDEEKYTQQIISNNKSGIVIEKDGTVQLSEKFLTLAVKKSVPYIMLKKNGIDVMLKSSVLKNLVNGKNSLFTFNVKPVDINDYPKRISMVLGGGCAVEVSVTKDGILCSDFPQYGGVEISFSLDESFKAAKRIYVYYMENSGCDPKPVTDFSIDENNVITVKNNKPGIFIVKKG